MRRAVIAVLAAVAAVGACSVDTELGVDATVEDVEVVVMGADPGATVVASFRATFRVGEHADGAREFVPGRAALFVGDALVGELVPSSSGTFDGRLEPGEMRTFTLTGASRPGAAPMARAALCAPGATATLVFRWEDRTRAESGATTGAVMQLRCDE